MLLLIQGAWYWGAGYFHSRENLIEQMSGCRMSHQCFGKSTFDVLLIWYLIINWDPRLSDELQNCNWELIEKTTNTTPVCLYKTIEISSVMWLVYRAHVMYHLAEPRTAWRYTSNYLGLLIILILLSDVIQHFKALGKKKKNLWYNRMTLITLNRLNRALLLNTRQMRLAFHHTPIPLPVSPAPGTHPSQQQNLMIMLSSMIWECYKEHPMFLLNALFCCTFCLFPGLNETSVRISNPYCSSVPTCIPP